MIKKSIVCCVFLLAFFLPVQSYAQSKVGIMSINTEWFWDHEEEQDEPDLSNIGGVTGWLKVAHLAEAHNLPVTTHGVHDLHVHLLAAVPNASFLEAHGFGLEDYIRHPLEIVEGEVRAPDRPGHGVEFDWHRLEEHRAAADE